MFSVFKTTTVEKWVVVLMHLNYLLICLILFIEKNDQFLNAYSNSISFFVIKFDWDLEADIPKSYNMSNSPLRVYIMGFF